jgi:DNA-binding NtrC family response regulator
MGVAHKQALMKLHKRTGPFAEVRNPVKFIFCLNEDLDTQFAKGAIDQDFYLIMGQKEIYVPRLDLCREDVPELAKQIASEWCHQHAGPDTFGGFSSEATELLLLTEWPHNYASLQAVIAKSLKLAKGSTITRDHLVKAIAEPDPLTNSETSAQPSQPTTRVPEAREAQEVPIPVNRSTAASTSTATRPKVQSSRTTEGEPMIQSFTMLENEAELARNILSPLVAR